MRFRTIEDAIEYLNRFQFHGFRLGLERMETILTQLDSPHLVYPCIHVAGTNGKGSVCAAVSSILDACGIEIGLYTSPHLYRLNERFQLNGQPVQDDVLKELIQDVATLVERGFELSYFEFTTAMAFLLFRQAGVDMAVVETGLGGRLDATNVVKPCVCAITNISLEHTAYLGDTLESIAQEKAGIIKHGVPVVTGALKGPALQVIEEVAKKESAPLFRLGYEFYVENFRDDTQHFDYRDGDRYLVNLHFGLFGRHQADNASIAIGIVGQLASLGFVIGESCIRKGLENAHWPGRSELLKGRFDVLLEGAHNEAGLEVLKRQIEFLDMVLSPRHKVLLWACSNEGDDKDPKAMLSMVNGFFDETVITEPIGPRRPVTIEEWKGMALSARVHFFKDLIHAASWLEKNLGKGDLLVVSGSLYLIGPIREFFLVRGWKHARL